MLQNSNRLIMEMSAAKPGTTSPANKIIPQDCTILKKGDLIISLSFYDPSDN